MTGAPPPGSDAPSRAELRDTVARALGREDVALLSARALSGIPRGGHSPNRMYRLRIRAGGAEEELVLRIYRGQDAAERFHAERTIYRVLRGDGIRLPQWRAGSARDETLGTPVALLESLPGRNGIDLMAACLVSGIALGLLGVRGAGLVAIALSGAATGRVQARLHRIPAEPLREALRDTQSALRLDVVAAALEEIASAIEKDGLRNLAPGLHWLHQNRPPACAHPVVCHGDLHPGNLVVSARGAPGVVDWEAAGIAPPEYDLAVSRARLTLQSELSPPLPAPLPAVVDTAISLLLGLVSLCHRLAYRASHAVDRERLHYLSALETLRVLARIERTRLVTGGRADPRGDEYDAAAHTERRIRRRFRRATGVALAPVDAGGPGAGPPREASGRARAPGPDVPPQ